MKNIGREKEEDITKFVESAELYARWLGEQIKIEQGEKELIDELVALLKKKTISSIVKRNKSIHEVFNEETPSDNYLLRSHLEMLISDFNCNIRQIEKKDIPTVARILNENPLHSFFISEESD